MIVFDIETDGLLGELTRIHCITLIDRLTGEHLSYNGGVYRDGSPAPTDGSIEDGVRRLMYAPALAGHHIIGFDIPAIQKLYQWFEPAGKIVDTKLLSQVIWPHLLDIDIRKIKARTMPPDFMAGGMMGRHTLEAWGKRLGCLKGEFKPGNFQQDDGKPHTWKSIGFTKEMDEYARQDPVVTLRLLELIESKKYSQRCIDLETATACIVFKQQQNGFAFDMKAAGNLVQTLSKRRADLQAQFAELFHPWYQPARVKGECGFTPKRDDRAKGYVAGSSFSKVKLVVFNPDSREHIADRLSATRGWKPTVFTPEGKPSVEESVLEALPWDEAKLLAEYLMVSKRLGQVAEGKEAWLKHATKTGLYGKETDGVWRVHGTVNTNGAVTGRMTHSSPNIGQVPAVYSLYGKECRACFTASPGKVLVGCDAEGIELRMLGHFMARYDGGAYVTTVVSGKKEDETDVHNVNKRAVELNSRDSAKTFIYAFIYGAGDYKLGTIVIDDFTDEQRKQFMVANKTKRARDASIKNLGSFRRERLLKNFPALDKLLTAVKARARSKGFLVGLDGRHLHCRAEHSALNTLLQSGGALVMKEALVLLDRALRTSKDSRIAETRFVANVHDEWQMETDEEVAEQVGKLAADCIKKAGESFELRCPLAGSYGVGRNWAETH